MKLRSAPCAVCGQTVIRAWYHFIPGVRVTCDDDCRALLVSMDAGRDLLLEPRLCLSCGDVFRARPSHVGVAHARGGADMCPACWRERAEAAEPDGPYLDSLASVFEALAVATAAARRLFWRPDLRCPRCGDAHRRAYEWSCRYPLAVGLCEAAEGPHVHSVCYRCGYETVRLQTKTPPAGFPTRGAVGGQVGAMMPVTESSARMAMRPESTTSLR